MASTRKSRSEGARQIFASAKKYRKWFVIGPFFKLVEAIFELMIPTLTVYIIDRGVTGRDGAYVMRMIPLMFGIAAAGYLSALVCQYVASLSSQGFGTELRARIFSHILHISQKDADKLGTSGMVNRVTNDVNVLQQAVAMLIRLAIRAPFICLGSLVMAAMLNLRLTLVILCALPFLITAVVLVMRRGVPLFAKVQKRLDNIAVISRENMSGARVIRAFTRTDNEKERFRRECDGYNQAVIRVNRVSSLLNPVTTLIMNIAVIAVLWFGGKLIGSGNMTGGQIIAFINYISYMVTALLVVANLVTLFTKAAASYRRVAEVFEIPAEGATYGNNGSISNGAADAEAANGTSDSGDSGKVAADIASDNGEITAGDPAVPAIEMRNVGLRYIDDDTVPKALEGVNLAVSPGTVLGIVGVTGSGKTSLVSLLTGLYAPTEGDILIRGRKIDTIGKAELRKTIAVASQQSILFTGTVRDNIRAGREDIDDGAIDRALKIACADGFVAEKGGLNAAVERGGVNFSGGQRQRLSVARAVAGKPDILILDDSFSALDNATAASMLRAITDSGIETLIIVSQRVGNVRRADKILVLDDGRPAGLGTHEELLVASPLYAEICRLSGEPEAPGDAHMSGEPDAPWNTQMTGEPAEPGTEGGASTC